MKAARNQNPFSGAWLERRSESRAEAGWVAQALAEPGTRFVLSCGTQHLIRRGPEAGIAFLDATHPLVHGVDQERLLLLGWFQGARCVLVDALPETGSLPAGTQLEDLRPLLTELPAAEAAVLACARALLIWRARHRHCGVCGAPTLSCSAGHSLQCSSSECGAEFFPRIDPAVIVLVSDGEYALLGRQSSWPTGRYSALAGFVEPGESLEDTVIREVHEESGVRAHAARYHASQPWPFPSSLMLGFHATASRQQPLRLDGELEDARWFSVAELQRQGPQLLPPHYTIARSLIDAWHTQITGTVLGG